MGVMGNKCVQLTRLLLNMKKKTKIEYKKASNQDRDYQKFYMVKPDPEFNPDRNKQVVEDSIKMAEDIARRKHADYLEKIAERADAAAHYAMYLERNGSSSAEKYFGKRILGQLQGRKIRKEVIDRMKGIYSIQSFEDEDIFVF